MYLRILRPIKAREELVREAMLEDREILGYSKYRSGVAELYVRCYKASSCFSTAEDRMRCLELVEGLYGIINTKTERKEESK